MSRAGLKDGQAAAGSMRGVPAANQLSTNQSGITLGGVSQQGRITQADKGNSRSFVADGLVFGVSEVGGLGWDFSFRAIGAVVAV